MREKLIEMIRKADKEDHESLTQDVHYAFMADHLIANGVTIPVRCKDCIHTRKKNGHEQFMYTENICICTKEDIWGITKNEPVWCDDSCSYGERRTDA